MSYRFDVLVVQMVFRLRCEYLATIAGYDNTPRFIPAYRLDIRFFMIQAHRASIALRRSASGQHHSERNN